MAKKKDWSHPKGKRFEELSASSKVDGVVVNVGDYGVFADIGYLTAYMSMHKYTIYISIYIHILDDDRAYILISF